MIQGMCEQSERIGQSSWRNGGDIYRHGEDTQSKGARRDGYFRQLNSRCL